MVKSGFHDSSDAQSVDVPHGEIVDPQAFQEVATEHALKGCDACQALLIISSCQRARKTLK